MNGYLVFSRFLFYVNSNIFSINAPVFHWPQLDFVWPLVPRHLHHPHEGVSWLHNGVARGLEVAKENPGAALHKSKGIEKTPLEHVAL